MNCASVLRKLAVTCGFAAAFLVFSAFVVFMMNYDRYDINMFTWIAFAGLCFAAPAICILLAAALRKAASGLEASDLATAEEIRKMKARIAELEK